MEEGLKEAKERIADIRAVEQVEAALQLETNRFLRRDPRDSCKKNVKKNKDLKNKKVFTVQR